MSFIGYGVKPARPLIWSALIIMLSAAFFKVYLSMPSGEAFFFSATAFTSGINPLLNSAIAHFPHGGYPLYVVTVERLLGPVFFAPFLASIAKTDDKMISANRPPWSKLEGFEWINCEMKEIINIFAIQNLLKK
jgi:hypothetical protein